MVFSMGEAVPCAHYGKKAGCPEPAGARTLTCRDGSPGGALGSAGSGWGAGLQPPVPLAEHLGTPFAQFLLSVVEDGLPSDTAEQLPDLCTNLLLALNLHLPGGGTREAAGQPGLRA